MLDTEKPNSVRAFVGGGIAVEEVTHCLVDVAFAVSRCGQQSGGLALWGAGGWGETPVVDEIGEG